MEHLERADLGIAVVTVIKSDKSDKRERVGGGGADIRLKLWGN